MLDRIKEIQEELLEALSTEDAALYRKIQRTLAAQHQQ